MIDKKTINQRIAIFIGICIIIIYFIPIILLGKDSYILIWDYLDGHLPRIKTVVDNGILFLPFSIIPIMGGLSRSSFSPPNLDIIIQSYLPEFWSIVVLVFIIKLTAFIGLFFLLKDHLLINNRQSIFVALFTSVLFALVPFHPVGGISSAGIPLLLYSFLNLMKNKGSFINWLIIIYYGFFSSLVLSGVFICFSLGVLLAVSWIRNKHLPLSAFWGLLLLCIVYGVTNYNLISDFFHADVGQSHREEFVSDASWLTVINKTKFLLLNSQGHCGSFLPGL